LFNLTAAAGIAQTSPELRSGIAVNNFQRMDGIDHQILNKEVELLRLNAAFRNHYTKPNKWKERRLKLYDLVGGGMANAGDITIMSQFWHYQNNVGGGLKHKGSLESGVITVMLAYLTLGSLYGAEGLADLAIDYKSIHQKMDAKSICKTVASLKADIDGLLENRRKMAAEQGQLAGTDQDIENTEERVLTGVRDQALTEFGQLYIDSRKRHTQRDITTIGTIAVCATGGFAAALPVIRGIEKVSLKEIGGGGIGFIVSGSTLAAAPVLIHGGAAISGQIATKKMSSYLAKSQEKTQETLAQDTGHLRDLIASASGNTTEANTRVGTYKILSGLMADRKSYLEAERRKQKHDMFESFISYGMKGGPQIAWGTFVTRAGYRYSANPSKAFHDIAVGATVNETAWGAWMLDTVQKGTRNEFRFARDAQNNPFLATNDKVRQLEAWRQ